VAFEPALSAHAEAFLASIAPFERVQFFRGLTLLALNPFPDGKSKVELPFPHRPGTLGTILGAFWVAYSLVGNEQLVIFSIAWSPESGRPGTGML